MTASAATAVPSWLSALAAHEPIVLDTDPVELAFHALDVYGAGVAPAAIARPRTVAALDALVRAAGEAATPLLPRGGGLSYTDGYLADRPDAVLVDLGALDRIEEINPSDGYVVVQAGVTWAALDAALAAQGLRTPYWGPLSGLRATVGGALSQGSVFLGSGLHGAIGDSVLGIEAATPRGLIRTGVWAAGNTAPFLRWFGPDLTGLFVGDAGSLGIKTRASLRLIPRPEAVGYASAAYGSAPAMLAAMAAISRRALASECFGFDPVLAQMRLRRASLVGDAKTLGAVVRRQGLVEGLKLVAAGRDFVGEHEWSVHVVVEADSPAALSGRLAEARRVLADAGGRAVEPSIPKVLRSTPFTPPNSILGPAGERWVPVHGVLPHSAAPSAWRAVQDLFDACADERARLGVSVGWLCTTLAQQGTLLEPVFYWPDAHTAYHRRVVEPDFLARVAAGDVARPEARALVARLKREASDLLRAHGAAHFQIGRWYRWREGRDPLALALYDAIKREIDPGGVLNPGVLR